MFVSIYRVAKQQLLIQAFRSTHIHTELELYHRLYLKAGRSVYTKARWYQTSSGISISTKTVYLEASWQCLPWHYSHGMCQYSVNRQQILKDVIHLLPVGADNRVMESFWMWKMSPVLLFNESSMRYAAVTVSVSTHLISLCFRWADSNTCLVFIN